MYLKVYSDSVKPECVENCVLPTIFTYLLTSTHTFVSVFDGNIYLVFLFIFGIFQALLHSVPLGKLIVLDLFADVKPIWKISSHFYGVPYIW